MDHEQPPAPGWTRGEDGHWRPPSLFGPTPAAGPAGPPAAWPTAGPPGPQPTAPPPPGRSAATTVFAVLGGIAACVVGLVVVSIAAVTFLGTSAEEEPRFVPVGSGPTDPLEPTTTSGPSSRNPDRDISIDAADVTTENLGAMGWHEVYDGTLGGDQDTVSVCSEGSTRGELAKLTAYQNRTLPLLDENPGLQVQIVSHEDEAESLRAMDVVANQGWRDCLVDNTLVVLPADSEMDIHLLPGDPGAPGIAYRVVTHLPGRPALEESILHVRVGRMRAMVDGWGYPPEDLRAAARAVAAALADVQGLPTPR